MTDRSARRAPGVVFADLTLRYDDQPTECPTDVTVEASFAGDAPGTFDVRFHDAFGRTSRPLEMTLSESDFDGTHYVTEFQRSFEVDTSPDDDGGLQVTPQTPPGDLTIGDGGGFGSPGGGLATGRDPDTVASSVWVEILSGGVGSIERSDSAAYEITCASGGGSLTSEGTDGTAAEPFLISPEWRYTPIRR